VRLSRDHSSSSTLRYDWIVVVLSAVFELGVVLDARGHLQGQVDSTLLSDRHAPLYGGVVLVGAFLAASAGRNRAYGFPWRLALPYGYDLSLAGVVLFLASGVADLFWHAAFGVETGLTTLLSPTHVLLALAGGLMVSGPLRATGHRLLPGVSQSWIALAPALIAAGYVFGLATILTAYAHPLLGPYAVWAPVSASRPAYLTQPLGVASILLQSAIQVGLLLLLVRTWRLPPGAVTVLIAFSSLPVILLTDEYAFVPAVLVAGVIADLIHFLVRPSIAQRARFSLFAFSVPLVFYSLYFLTLQVGSGLGWSVHLVAGAVVLAGVTGLLVSFLIMPSLTGPTRS
jgi:hypothetical protein